MVPDHSVDDFTRRGFLGAAAAGGLLLAGCGGTSSSTQSTSVAAKPKYGGTLRVGTSDGSTRDSLDPNLGNSNYTNQYRGLALYDTLLTTNHRFDIVPHLATEFTPNSTLTSYTVRLQDGVTFHNGKSLTADDLIFSLQRILNPKAPSDAIGLFASINPHSIKKLDQLTVRIDLYYPDAGLPEGFSLPGPGIVPVGYDVMKPVGTGPFKFVSFTPGQRSVFVRNPDYWVSGQPYLDELQVIDFADPGTTRINALVSDEIDAVDHVDPALFSVIQGASNVKLVQSHAAQLVDWEMRVDVPPFNDVRVRQAMRLIVDRNQVIEQAFSGHGYVGNDYPAIQDALYDQSIPQRTQDIDQAKFLLKQAGQAALQTQLAFTNAASGVVQSAQVLAQQAKAAGVTLHLLNLADSAQYFSNYYLQGTFKFDYYNTYRMWQVLGLMLASNGAYNLSHWNDPGWESLYHQARSSPDVSKQKELLGEAQRIFYDRGSIILPAFYTVADAYSVKFTVPTSQRDGEQPMSDLSALGFNDANTRQISLA